MIELVDTEDIIKIGHKIVEIRKCCRCGSSETNLNSSGVPKWYNCICDKEICTKYLCDNCYGNAIYDADWRKGNLDPLSSSGKGFIGAQIIAKTYGVDDCNIKMNNFNFYVDLSNISGYGIGEVKTASLLRGGWYFKTNRPQEYGTLFLVCMDLYWPWKNVERIYAIPWDIAVNREKGSIVITKNPSRGIQWYDEFEINEKPFNETYHTMKLENCKILRKKNI